MAILSDPFDALIQLQQALDAYRTSSWLGSSLSGGGAYPPLNVFRKGDDIVVIIEVPGVRSILGALAAEGYAAPTPRILRTPGTSMMTTMSSPLRKTLSGG